MSTRTKNAVNRRNRQESNVTTKQTTRTAKRAGTAKPKPTAPKATPKQQKSITRSFVFLRETPNKLRFDEVKSDDIGGLYVRKTVAALFGFTENGKLGKDAAQKTLTLRFVADRTTPNKVVFAEQGHQDAIGSLYIRKENALGVVKGSKVKVTLSPVKIDGKPGVKLTVEIA